MALKGDRTETIQEISYFMNETATRGGCVVMPTTLVANVPTTTAGSGSSLDNAAQLATYTYISGAPPLGILMQDMVDVDQTKYHINPYKDEAQKGSKVRVLREGWVVTNMIYPGTTPTAGGYAYVYHSGYITPTQAFGGSPRNKIGVFETTKDEDGYARVYVKLPNLN